MTLWLVLLGVGVLVPWPGRACLAGAIAGVVATLGVGCAALAGVDVSYAFLPLLGVSVAVQALVLRTPSDGALRVGAALPIGLAALAETVLPTQIMLATGDLVWLAAWLGVGVLLVGAGLVLGAPARGPRWLLPALLALALLLMHGEGWPVMSSEGAASMEAAARHAATAWVVGAAFVLAASTLLAFLVPRAGGALTAAGCGIAAFVILAPGLWGMGVDLPLGSLGVGTALHVQLVWAGAALGLAGLMLARDESHALVAWHRLVGMALLALGSIAWLLMRDGLALDANPWLEVGMLAAALPVIVALAPTWQPAATLALAGVWMGLLLLPGGLA